MSILLICTTASVAYNFRRDLINALKAKGYEVFVIIGEHKDKEKVEALDVEVFVVEAANTSINPFKKNAYKKRLEAIIKEIAPETVFSFMLTPAIFGTLAAKKCGVAKIFAMIEGMGRVYTFNTLKNRALKAVVNRLLKKSLKHADKVFLLNTDDVQYFKSKRLANESKLFLINGIGVNLEEFEFVPPIEDDVFLLVARLIEEKGIFEFCEAADIVKQVETNARFCLLGIEDTITKEDLAKYSAVEYLGTTNDMAAEYAKCSVFVLPSFYKEGLPRSIMEAMAVGRPILTTLTNGCKDMVEDGVNGYKVPLKRADLLAEKMLYMIKNRQDNERMGLKSRRMAKERYCVHKINDIICGIIEKE